ncbi:hypothetical protein [Actinoplanes solisilvae]|uniref:hypothetical protein n=1 Tax=Actinoplanes solisilvae TaxID=2486853 RepID=UPI0013E2B944|nr:hypothetical protein [Actinoplanes solisilvae]
MPEIPFGAQLIGRTEKALNALLERELSGTGLTEPQWVALTLTVGPVGPASSVSPASPVSSVGPASPVSSVGPASSVGSVGPVSPVGPVGPGAVPVGRLAARISEALRTDGATAGRLLSELAAKGLLRETAAHAFEPTESGRSLWLRVRSATATLTADLWGDLRAEDRDAAARVLNVVLTRAGAALSAR